MEEVDMQLEPKDPPRTVEEWRNAVFEPRVIPEASASAFEDERIFWNEPDGIVIKKSEYGGALQKNWETAKDKLCGRFFFPDGSSLTWDVCARDRLRDFNLVCLKCGDVFACAPNNMTRTGNRHIKSKHPTLKCISATVPFYKIRSENDPIAVVPSSDATTATDNPAFLETVPLASASLNKIKARTSRCSEIDKKRLDRYVSAMLARCGLPSRLADHASFREFVEELTNNEYVPADSVAMEKEQDKMYSVLMDELKVDFEKQGPNTVYNISADMWSFRNEVHFVILNVYCVDSRWRHLKATIAVRATSTDKIPMLISDTLADCFGIYNKLKWDRILTLTTNSQVNSAVGFPVLTTACPCFLVQGFLKETLHMMDNPRTQPIRDVLKKFVSLASQVLNSSLLQTQLASQCLEVEPVVQDLSHPCHGSTDDRLDSELFLLQFMYRLRRVFARVALYTTSVVGSRFDISEAEWALTEQLLAVLGRVHSFNLALGAHTVGISKVYPSLLALHRSLINPQLSCPSSDIPAVAAKAWDHDLLDCVQAVRQTLAARIEATFPALTPSRTLDKWSPNEVERFEPYLIAMSLDPTLSSTYEIFRHPQHPEPVNTAFIASIKAHEISVVQRAAMLFHNQFNGGNTLAASAAIRPTESPSLSAALLSTAEGFLHNRAAAVSSGGLLDEVPYPVVAQAPPAKAVYGSAEDIADECAELFGLFKYSVAAFEHPFAEPEAVREIKRSWEAQGGWDGVHKTVELFWWERHANMFPCLQRLAVVYGSIPASTCGTRKFAPADGPQSILGGAGLAPSLLEKTLFVRENFHNGILDVPASLGNNFRKRKRAKSTGGPGAIDLSAVDFPDHNRQQPPKFLQRLITSTVSLEGDVNWRTKVMKPTGDLTLPPNIVDGEGDAPETHIYPTFGNVSQSSPTPFYQSTAVAGASSSIVRPDPHDAFEFKQTMRHTFQIHLEAIRDFIVDGAAQFKVSSWMCKPFETHP